MNDTKERPGTPSTADFDFDLNTSDGQARAGTLTTPHGQVLTPVFMPVGTQATVKAVPPRDLRDLGVTAILANTYHLYLRPGDERIARLGGIHTFMGWDGPVLTDSGGFQVFSLANIRRIDGNGVTFRSHIDGSEHRFTPEKVIAIQENLGADMITCLDECAEPSDYDYNVEALARTHAWASRCRAAKRRSDQALFGIVQGGTDVSLRLEHLDEIGAMNFDGLALGGLSVGEPNEEMHRVVQEVGPKMAAEKPRYLMGVGTPEDILHAVENGIDMFDCVLPTRNARNGQAFVHGGRINIKQNRYAEDPLPLEPGCACPCCSRFERRYLRHLFNVGEMLVLRLITLHNLYHYGSLMTGARQAIAGGYFGEFKQHWSEPLRSSS